MSAVPDLHVICALPGEAGTVAQRGAAVSICGMGAAAARACAEQALDAGARVIISWGVAGGLAPGLCRGDLFLPREVTDGAGRVWDSGGRDGRLLSVPDPVTDADAKARLWRATGCGAVDMEGAAIAEACALRGASFVSVRAIADPARRSLPAWLPSLLNADGRPRLGRLAAHLMREPRAVTALLDCAADYRSALQTLRRAAVDLTGLVEAAA